MASIEILEEAKWTLVGFDLTSRYRIVADIDRLEEQHRAGKTRRLAGTRHVYRVQCGNRVVLYHERAGRLTILVIR